MQLIRYICQDSGHFLPTWQLSKSGPNLDKNCESIERPKVKALVTGGGGFLGQYIVEQLLEEYKQTQNSIEGTLKERVAASLALAAAIW